jgi:NOL1/NOP2/sun family putative RNA methylase
VHGAARQVVIAALIDTRVATLYNLVVRSDCLKTRNLNPPKSRGARRDYARPPVQSGGSIPALPPRYLDRMHALLGDEFPAFRACYDAPSQPGLRVNTLKVTPERFLQVAPFELEPAGLAPEAFFVSEEDRPGAHPYHAAGLYYLQDPSAMAVTFLLDPQPGERILDLAAAPGGKSTHIAARMAGQGVLVANEVHPKRVWTLAENLERWGARNAMVLNEQPERLADRLAGHFDGVLLDAPCSGEGLFRKNPAARLEWSPALVDGCARRQGALLTHAARLVRPGGVLVYSTCTFSPEENEAVVSRYLRDHPEFALASTVRLPGFQPGHPEWAPDGGPDALRRAIRIWPHIGPGEGHFVAVLRREDGLGSTSPDETGAPIPAAPSRATLTLYRDFCEEHLTDMPGAGRLVQAGSYLYALPDAAMSIGALHVIHPGWWLGVVKTGRFEPSHALAMALAPDGVRQSLSLAPDDPRLQAYLCGQGFADSGSPGWVLVAVDGFPLGWGKRSPGVLKSRYPKGLRRQTAVIGAPHQ